MKEVNPKETTRAYAFETYAHAYLFQDNRCNSYCPHQQTDWTKV